MSKIVYWIMIMTFALTMCLVIGGCEGSEAKAYHLMMVKTMAENTEKAIAETQEKLATVEQVIADYQEISADPNIGVPYKEEIDKRIAEAIAVKAKVDIRLEDLKERATRLSKVVDDLMADGLQPGEYAIGIGEGFKETGGAIPGPIGAIMQVIGGILVGYGTNQVRKWKSDVKHDKIEHGLVASFDDALEVIHKEDKSIAKQAMKAQQLSRGIHNDVRRLMTT